MLGARAVVAACLAVLLGSATGFNALCSPSLEFVSQLGGTCPAVAADGGYVYLAEGPRLVVLDVSNPAAPVEVGRSAPLANAIQALAVADGYAYAGLDLYGLAIVSVADPTRPVWVGSLESLDAVLGVAVNGDRVALAERYEGVSIASIADKTAPRRLGSLSLPGRTTGVCIDGDLIFAAAGDGGLRLVSIADPAAPAELGACTTLTAAVSVAIAGSMAYVSDETRGLLVISVADPAAPTEVGAVALRHTLDVRLSGDVAYVANQDLGLVAVSVADPTTPIVLGASSAFGDARALALFGDLVFVAAGAGGLRVASVADPATPQPIGAFNTASYGTAVMVDQAAGDLLYLIDSYRGVHVISLADPETPSEVALFPAAGCRCLGLRDSFAYLGTQETLLVLDVSVSGTPIEIARLALPGTVRDLVVSDGTLYAACDSAGLAVVSIADPRAPSLVGSLALPGPAYGVDIRNGVAYVAAWDAGLRVVSITDPGQLSEVGVLATTEAARDVFATATTVYLSEQNVLHILDVTNPSQPTETSTLFLGLRASVDVVEDLLAVAYDWRGVSLYSLADPAEPQEVSYADTADRASDVGVLGHLVCVADEGGGLYVFRVAGDGRAEE